MRAYRSELLRWVPTSSLRRARPAVRRCRCQPIDRRPSTAAEQSADDVPDAASAPGGAGSGLACRATLLLRDQAEHNRREDRQKLPEVDPRRLRLRRELLRDGVLLLAEDVPEDLLTVRGVDAVDIHCSLANRARVPVESLQDRLRAFGRLRVPLQTGQDRRAALLDRLPRNGRVDPELGGDLIHRQ